MSERGKHKHSASTTPSSSVKLPGRYHTLRPTPSPTRTADKPFTASSISYTLATSPKQPTRTISLNTPKAATMKAKHHTSASTTTFYLSSLQPHSASATSLFASTSSVGSPRHEYGTVALTPRSGISRALPDTPTRSRPAYSATLTPSSPSTALAITSSPTTPINMTLPFAASSMQSPVCSACELPVAAHVKPVLITDKQTNETFHYHQEHFCCHMCQLPLTTATLKRKQHTLYCPEHYPYPSCQQCGDLITGPSITALDRTYHPEHFTCAVCPTVITEAKFAHYDGKAYCAHHYAELERQCALCSLPVKVSDMKTTANRECYHAACLACWVCGGSRGTMLRSKGRMYCQPHGSALLYHRCAECGLYIDKPVHAPNGQYYHEDCLRCAVCQSVMDGWHTSLGQLRCGKHADMRSEAKDCARCGQKVEEGEVVKSMGRVYHTDCYKCTLCERRVDAKSCQLLDNALCCVDCWLSRQPGQEARRLPLTDSTAQHNNSTVPLVPGSAATTYQPATPPAEGEQNKQPANSSAATTPSSPAVKRPSASTSTDSPDKPLEESKEQSVEPWPADVKDSRPREHTRELSLNRSPETSRLVQAIQGKALPPLPLSYGPAPLNTSSTSSGVSAVEASVSPSHASCMPAPSPPTTPNRSAVKPFFASPSLGPVVPASPTPPMLPTTPPLPSSRPFIPPPPPPVVYRPSTPTQVKLGDLIATGTFGSVYTALDLQTGEHLAVKVLKEHDMALLDHEVNLLKQLCHPNIVGFRGVREVEGKLHIYMEYVEGKSLVHQLARWGPFAEPLIKRYTRQLLSALSYCHDMRVTHRDIKGKNILVTTSGQVKLCDFGSAKKFVNDMTSEHPTKSYTFTVQWTAPEVVQGDIKYNTKVDVWSLGCVLIEMASGKAPWDERMHEITNQFRLLYIIGHTDDKPAIPANLSHDCRQFVDLMLTKDPERRPTARELLGHPWLREERAGIPQHVRSASAKEEKRDSSGAARLIRGKSSISGEHRYAAVVEEQKEQLTTGPAGQQRRSHSALLHGMNGLRIEH